ncbi:hypothetical protein J4526_03700 [Desulfurococcaceae archaeon MEX13E-LK6-19]|nr:hypothetical protein J4526_03700 [Desulfurococcaceae archaeon MEX13E-LK6-19]
MSRLLTLCLLVSLLFTAIVPVTVESTLVSNVLLDNSIDLMYSVNWSRVYSSKLLSSCLRDYNNDNVNDVVVIIGNKDIEVIDPLTNSTLMKYTGDYPGLYSLIPLDDIDRDSYNELLAVYLKSTSLKVVLIEPGTNSIVYEKTYSISIDGDIIRIPQNTILRDNVANIIVPAIKQGYLSIELKDYLYKINVSNGDLISSTTTSGKLYSIWTNHIITDTDGDGLIDLRRDIVVKAYTTLSLLPPSLSTTVSVSSIDGSWSWSISKTDYTTIGVFKPYTKTNNLLVLLFVHINMDTGTADKLVIEAYHLLDGSLVYTLSYNLDSYEIHTMSLAGEHLVVDIVDKDTRQGELRVYNTTNGILEETIEMNTVPSGENITSMSIGDLWGDNVNDLLVGIADKLYLVSINGSIDYLGRMPGSITLFDGNTIIYSNTRLHMVQVKINDETYKLQAISIVENTTTTPPSIKIIEPTDNAIVETPFNVRVVVEGNYTSSPVLEIYSQDKLVARKEMSLIEDNIFEATITDLDDGEYTLLARIGDYSSNPIRISVDNTPPVIVLYEPGNQSYVGEYVKLRLYINEPHFKNITIYVNNSLHGVITVNDTYEKLTYNEPVDYLVNLTSLPDGALEIKVIVVDVLGHTSTLILNYIKDTIPPTINISAPYNIIVNNTLIVGLSYKEKPYPVNIRVVDNNALKTLVIIVNNVEIEKITSGYKDKIEKTIEFSLKPGYNNVTVIAVDATGKTSISTIMIYMNTVPPSIELQKLSIRDREITYRVIAYTNNTIVPLARIEVRLCRKTPVTGIVYNKTFTTNTTTQLLEDYITVPGDGLYILEITAIDASGNQYIIKQKIIIDTTPPVIEIKDTKLEDHKLTIEWNIHDNLSGVKQVLLYIDGEPVDVTNKTKYTIELEPGTHNITIIAIDNNGNKAIEQLQPITISEETETTTTETQTISLEDIVKSPTIIAIILVLLALAILMIYRMKSK